MAKDDVRAVVRGLEKFTTRVITKITLDVVANLVETTPIDTGWARANWVPSIGTSFIANLEGIQPDGPLAAKSADEQAAAVAEVLANYKLDRGSVFVTNNVTYISELNEGKSRQEPAAFVQRAIEKAITVDIQGLES